MGWRDIEIDLFVCLCVSLTNHTALGRSGLFVCFFKDLFFGTFGAFISWTGQLKSRQETGERERE